VKDFQAALQAKGVPLAVVPGCEVHHCPDMATRIAAGEATFLNTAKTHILVEFPFETLSEVFTGELAKLISLGITPVLAHPERNLITWHHPEILLDCITMGCLVQINGTSITGGFGNAILENANRLLRHRMVHVIASDAHSSGHRCPALSLAAEFAGKVLENPSEAMAMVNETPRRILDGKPVPVPEPVLPKGKKSRGFMRRA
jgi:protein-tyrosine phosphatase